LEAPAGQGNSINKQKAPPNAQGCRVGKPSITAADTSVFSAHPLLQLRAEWVSGKRKAELKKPQAWQRLLAQGAQLETSFQSAKVTETFEVNITEFSSLKGSLSSYRKLER
jgi:hypothetical protein